MALESDLVGEAAADRHVVHFYDHDEELAAGVAPYVAEVLRAGGTAIVIATEAHRQAFTAQLEDAAGLNPWPASASLVMLDAREAADALLFDGRIAPHRFEKLIGDLVREAAAQGRPLRAYGEIVAVLWADGHVPAALELEELWNDLGREVDFELYCAYPRAWMEAESDALHEVCRRHSAVVGPPVVPEPVPAMPCELEAEFPWSGRSPGQARHFVVDTLAAWGYWALLADAALITTELATNAVLHAQSAFTVVVSHGPEGIRIAVRDASLVRPQPRRASPFETSGRGLRLVAALSARWGSDLVPGGKMIWAELELPAVIAS